METCIQRGTRVIRGPDWTYKDQDGGKGHAGTVLSLQAVYQPYFAKQTVLVQWDDGRKGLYRTGYNQAYDLRILETTKSGNNNNCCGDPKFASVKPGGGGYSDFVLTGVCR